MRTNSRAARALDAIDANICVLNNQGVIVATNRAWRYFAAKNSIADGTPPRHVEVGCNYLSVCDEAAAQSTENLNIVCDGIRAVLDGKRKSFSYEYPCHSPEKQRWFLMKVNPLRLSKPREVLILHVDITERWLAEMNLLAKHQELAMALAQLQLLAKKIKDSIGQEVVVNSPKASAILHQTENYDRLLQSEVAGLKSLSKRELEVLTGLVRGERNIILAGRLKLSTKSISTYRSRVLEKMRMENDAELVAFAARSGLI